MKLNKTFNIATGHSARSKVWKNVTITWEELVARLSEPVRTSETFKEYQAASREERSKIKDVGGYVGGYLRGGRRKPENVVHRQLLTLDLDFAHMDVWDDFTLQFSNAAVLHATHSHSPENPKFRLIMPLDREVTPDEYVAIGRRVAGDLGIEYFDNTGFQPFRLMFWASCSKDVDFYFRLQGGPYLGADDVLGSYIDWKDSSLWPTSGAEVAAVQNIAKKQQNPEEKKGVIGAFCRTYTIEEALDTFLKDKYQSAGVDRYTYLGGSTAGGLIVYDNKFTYSHHGTDPTSGQLCNAFDLVRLHLFGHLDDENQTGKPGAQPSFKAMEELARNDNEVRRTIASENLSSSKYDFAEPVDLETEDAETLDWAAELEIDARGKYLSSANNFNLILAEDPRLKGAFSYNLFDGKRYIVKSVPWRKVPEAEPIKNVDYSGVRNYIESIYGMVGTSKIDDCLALVFERNAFHPIKDYLEGLTWDKTPRLDSLLIDYFGAEDNLYTRESIRKMLVGAVARIFRPGIKFDLVLTIVGEQGDGKSTFINQLGGKWFSDTFMTVHGKEAFEQLQGAWLIEIAELSGLRKAEVEAVKHFITKQEDTYRPAYARSTETYLRQCVFFGTTNKRTFLTDPTGNRRFMPIDTCMRRATKDVFRIPQDEVDQIWAEAVARYTKGEKLFLSARAEHLAKGAQHSHREEDERVGLVDKYLSIKLPKNWDELDIFERRLYLDTDRPAGDIDRDFVCVAEIWAECLGKNKEDMDRYKTRDLNDILRGLEDWEESKSTRNFPLYGKQKYYSRKLF